jgi:hypothetical protein
VFYIPEPWIENTSWIKIISHHKTWKILFITYLPPHTCLFGVFILQMAWRRNTLCDNKKYHMSVITLISGKICDKKIYLNHKSCPAVSLPLTEFFLGSGDFDRRDLGR